MGLISGIQPVRVWINVNSPISPQTSDTTLRKKNTHTQTPIATDSKNKRQMCNKPETQYKLPILALLLLSNGTAL